MSQQEAPAQTTDQSLGTVPDDPLQQIDIEHYRTEELVENISDLISIPSFIVRIFKCMFSVVVASWIVIPWVFGHAGVGWIIPLVLYGTVGALVFGTALGITYSVGRAFGNMIQIADLTFHISDQVVHDFRSLADGKKTWPSPRQFVVTVYDFVIIPSVEAAFEKVFWFFGTFIVWAYKKTLGRIVRYMLKYTPAGNIDDEQDGSVSGSDLDDASETARHTWIHTTRQWINTLGTRLLWVMLFPLILLCTAVAGFAVAPLVVAWRWLLF